MINQLRRACSLYCRKLLGGNRPDSGACVPDRELSYRGLDRKQSTRRRLSGWRSNWPTACHRLPQLLERSEQFLGRCRLRPMGQWDAVLTGSGARLDGKRGQTKNNAPLFSPLVLNKDLQHRRLAFYVQLSQFNILRFLHSQVKRQQLYDKSHFISWV